MTNHFFGDTAILLRRSMRHMTRSLDRYRRKISWMMTVLSLGGERSAN